MLIRQVLGAIAEFDKAKTVAKLRGTRDRLRAKAVMAIELATTLLARSGEGGSQTTKAIADAAQRVESDLRYATSAEFERALEVHCSDWSKTDRIQVLEYVRASADQDAHELGRAAYRYSPSGRISRHLEGEDVSSGTGQEFY
jgi:hypothetical protein